MALVMDEMLVFVMDDESVFLSEEELENGLV